MVVCFNQKVIDYKMIDLKMNYRNAGFKFQFFSISAFTTFATNKARGFECSQIKKNGRTSKMDVSTQPQIFFLILRRNEAERKHSAKKSKSTILFSHRLYSFGMHATKGSI